MEDQVYQSLTELEQELKDLKTVKDFYETLRQTGDQLLTKVDTAVIDQQQKLEQIRKNQEKATNKHKQQLQDATNTLLQKINSQIKEITQKTEAYATIEKDMGANAELLEAKIQEVVGSFEAQVQQLNEQTAQQQETVQEQYDKNFKRFQDSLEEFENAVRRFKPQIETIEKNTKELRDDMVGNHRELSIKLSKLDDLETKLDTLHQLTEKNHQETTQANENLLEVVKRYINWPWRKVK
ncbi:MAG TPA: hypothetical protein DCS93_07990 [Microscillaceae bacterium]|nr:hypothetical protein [Microscillaceae bacterium]